MKGSIKVELFAGDVPALNHPMAVLRLTAQPTRPPFRHNALVLDCSGSMYGSLEAVKADAAAYVAELDETNYVSVVAFSGHRTAHRVCGPVRCDAVGKELLARSIRSVQIMNTTVFSEPLELVLDNLRQTDIEGMASQAILFTDGCAVPTYWGVEEEELKAVNAAKALADFGAIVSTIGYGFHYDPDLCNRIAQVGGGIFRHMNDVQDFTEVIRDIHDTFDRVDMSAIELDFARSDVHAVYRALPEVVQVGSSGHFTNRGLFDKSVTYYIHLARVPSNLKVNGHVGEEVLNKAVAPKPLTDELKTECVRVIAAHAAISGDVNYALELLTQLGEDGVAQTLSESHTERERRTNADKLRRAFRGSAFIGAGLKPSGPNHCLVNVFEVLISDPTVKISMPANSYKRGGLLTRDPRIVDSPLGKTLEVTGLVTHEERWNFSLGAKKHVGLLEVDGNGAIDSSKPAKDIAIPRTYNIVRDGELVMPVLLAAVSEETFKKLKEAGVIKARTAYQPGRSYRLHLSELKMVSSAWARPNGLRLGDLLAEVKELEAEQKALNARLRLHRGEVDPDEPKPDFDGDGNYREQSQVVEGKTIEYYRADCVQLRLMKYKAQDYTAKVSVMDVHEVETRVKEVRSQLRAIRGRIRTVAFACELTGWKAVDWGTPKATARGKDPKSEYTTHLGEYEVKRVVWSTEVACS